MILKGGRDTGMIFDAKYRPCLHGIDSLVVIGQLLVLKVFSSRHRRLFHKKYRRRRWFAVSCYRYLQAVVFVDVFEQLPERVGHILVGHDGQHGQLLEEGLGSL